jgi:SpoVK/Ycf46/Vps4 family AAA+-type ATPase
VEELAQRIEPVAGWNDIVLPEAQKQILRELTAQVRQRKKVYQDWGFAGTGSRGLGISALFAGESGTGKTMAAEVLANELQLDLYRIDLSQVVNKYIGETEKNLKQIFDAAEEGGAILLFDEADALFGKRSDVKDSHDRYSNIEVSYLLQRMEAYGGLAVLTTNMKGALDKAFLRRIRFVVQFPYPDAAHRADIELHIDELVLDGFENYNAHQIGSAIEQEITRLLQEQGLPAGFYSNIDVEHLNAGKFSMQPEAKAGSVGNNIAHSVYKGLQRENHNSQNGK